LTEKSLEFREQQLKLAEEAAAAAAAASATLLRTRTQQAVEGGTKGEGTETEEGGTVVTASGADNEDAAGVCIEHLTFVIHLLSVRREIVLQIFLHHFE